VGNKHAYLILAHHEFHILNKLIHELDDERNDIYIHIDMKTKYVDEDMISSWAKRADVFFVPRRKVFWGTISVVMAEISLLEEAVKRKYRYYHLISGCNHPLRSQDEIHGFFENKDREYIDCHRDGDYGDSFLYQIKYYHPLVKLIGRDSFEGSGKKKAFMRWLSKQQPGLIKLQEKLGIDRTKKYKDITFYKGEQLFSITHDFALFILSQKKKIQKMFGLTYGADKLVMPTFAMNSEFAQRVENLSPSYTDRICAETDASYEFTEDDYEKLIGSGDFFTPKLSFDRHPLLVSRLSARLHHVTVADDKPLISIIVPCYNVEGYLKECVDSLVAQSYSNIEVLLIDDGSTDATSAIAKDYSEKSDKVFYHHRVNGGLSAARNTGLELARGEYIAFVDSDDWVDENYISSLYDALKSGYADFSVCGYIKEFEGDASANESVSFDRDMVLSSHSAMNILGDIYPKENVLLVVAWNKLFKRSVLENIRFPEGRIHEDEFTIHRFIGAADSIAVTTANLYHYRIREGSITSGKKKQDLRHLDYLDALRDRLEYSETMLYGDLLIYMLYAYFEGIKQLMAMYSDETVSQKKLFWYFRKRAIEVYVKYHKELSGYQKRDYIKLILSPSRYRKIVLKQIKEKN
jgi:glycosyltransferase involved in cell wall biosynthesis